MNKTFIPDSLIFDVDGVLLNVEKSFPEVIRQCVLSGWEELCGGISDSAGYTPNHERILKRHGAFNDDYDIAWTLLCVSAAGGEKKLSAAFPSPSELAQKIEAINDGIPAWVFANYGNTPSRDRIREMCADLYFGKGREGLHKLEAPMLSCHWSELPLPAAVYTGRNLAEWELAKLSLGWSDFPAENVVHLDCGISKPSPEGLEILCGRMGTQAPLFFGDTASDMKAQAAFGKGKFVAIGDLLPEAELVYKDTESAISELIDFRKGK